jgi:hypothetical protein
MTKANTSKDLLAMIDPFGGLYCCWNYIGKRKHRDGYGYPKRNQKSVLAHRWSYEHHYGTKLKPTTVIRHICDNPACCNPLHLIPGTQKENVEDMMKRNRKKITVKRMFTQEQLLEMQKLKEKNWSQQKIANLFKCSQVIISYWEKKNFIITKSKYE